MNWKEVKDQSEFLELSHKVCLIDEARYSLLYGLALGCKSAYKLLSYGDSAIAIQTSKHKPLVVSDLSEEEAKKLALLIDNSSDIKEIVATKETVNHVLDNLPHRHPGYPEMLMNQKIYTCSKVDLPSQDEKNPTKLIQATAVHLPLVKEWFTEFMLDAYIDTTPEDKTMQELAETRISLGQVFLLMKDGNPVSMCCSARPTKNSITVNGVFTPIERRGEGFASYAVGLLSQSLLKDYKSCSLYTDATNPTSNKIYTNIGYAPVCESLHYQLKE